MSLMFIFHLFFDFIKKNILQIKISMLHSHKSDMIFKLKKSTFRLLIFLFQTYFILSNESLLLKSVIFQYLSFFCKSSFNHVWNLLLFKCLLIFFECLQRYQNLVILFLKHLEFGLLFLKHILKNECILLCLSIHLIKISELKIFRINLSVEVLYFFKKNSIFLIDHLKIMLILTQTLLKFINHIE